MFEDLIPGGGAFDDLIPAAPRADPKIGQPEELTWAEKLADMLPASWGAANVRGSAVGRLAKGAADPGAAIVQMVANALPGEAGATVNKAIKGREDEYQQARTQAGSDGWDLLRDLGGYAVTAPVGGLGAGIAKGAAMGAGSAALTPVTNGGDHFWTDKAKDAAVGAAGGAVLSPLLGALARVVSPKASQSADLKLLRGEGVNPTLGQAGGGALNTLEEKAMSWPVIGDKIAAARRGGIEDFNNAVINRSVEPIGGKVQGAGHEAIAEAGDMLSDAYNKAAKEVKFVNFDTPAFNQKFMDLQDMATGLSPDLAKRFDQTVNRVLLRKMSPNGSIDGRDLKAVDSELGKLAANFRGSSTASEREFGDAVRQLQQVYREGIADASPGYAAAKEAADKGWSWLTRVETAGKNAVNNEGIFTPAQWNRAVRQGDSSVRDRATARGEALGQDIGRAAQNVLGNKYPDSGTAGRLFFGLGNIPLAAAGAAGSVLYTKPVQNALVRLLAERPDAAPIVANYLRQLSAPAAAGMGPLLREGRE